MNFLYAILVFFLVGLLYSHLVQEFAPTDHDSTSSSPIEVYELDYIDPLHFQEVCRVRQPVVILDPPAFPSTLPSLHECAQQFPKQTLCVKNRMDFPEDTQGIDVPFHTAMGNLFVDSKSATEASNYFTEDNGPGFLRATGLDRILSKEADPVLAPPMIMHRACDWLTGGAGVTTPLRYHTYSRKYLRVIEGPSVHIKLIPRSHFFHERCDYDTYTFVSEVDPWEARGKHQTDMNRLVDMGRVAEIELHCGQMLYLPPYWWYSIRYPSSGTVLVEHTYATYMNRLASVGDLARHWLQKQTTIQIVLRSCQGVIHRAISTEEGDDDKTSVPSSLCSPPSAQEEEDVPAVSLPMSIEIP
jgi:hypothetical protein